MQQNTYITSRQYFRLVHAMFLQMAPAAGRAFLISCLRQLLTIGAPDQRSSALPYLLLDGVPQGAERTGTEQALELMCELGLQGNIKAVLRVAQVTALLLVCTLLLLCPSSTGHHSGFMSAPVSEHRKFFSHSRLHVKAPHRTVTIPRACRPSKCTPRMCKPYSPAC